MKYLVTEKTASFLRKIQQSGGYTGKPGPTRREVPSRGLPDRFPPPYTVRWSQSENDGAGAWCIWLPDLAKLFAYGGTYATLDGVTACSELPAGWYTVDDSTGATDTAMYLVVTIADDDTITSAVISVEEGQGSTGTTVVNIPVAAMSVDATTGAKSVKQFVDSAVLLGDGGGGGGGGGGGYVTPDDVSVDFRDDDDETSDGALQIKDWDHASPPAATTTIAEDLVASNPTDTVVARQRDKALKYKPPGKFSSGSDSNITFTPANGVVRVNVYYV